MSIFQPHAEDLEDKKARINVKNFKFPQMRSKLSLNDIHLEKKK